MAETLSGRGSLYFLHGWGCGPGVLNHCVRYFGAEWNMKALALPGYNGTPFLAKGLEGVVSAIMPEVPDNAVLVGWSLGGLIGIRVAAMKPLKKLILLASTPCFVNKHDWHSGLDVEVIEGLRQRLTRNPGRTLREFALLVSQGDHSPRATLRALQVMLEKDRTPTGALLDGLDILQYTDLRAEFSALECSVGVVLAANDALVSIASGSGMALLRSGLDIVAIQDSGHAPLISSPAQTVRQLIAMVGRLCPYEQSR